MAALPVKLDSLNQLDVTSATGFINSLYDNPLESNNAAIISSHFDELIAAAESENANLLNSHKPKKRKFPSRPAGAAYVASTTDIVGANGNYSNGDTAVHTVTDIDATAAKNINEKKKRKKTKSDNADGVKTNILSKSKKLLESLGLAVVKDKDGHSIEDTEETASLSGTEKEMYGEEESVNPELSVVGEEVIDVTGGFGRERESRREKDKNKEDGEEDKGKDKDPWDHALANVGDRVHLGRRMQTLMAAFPEADLRVDDVETVAIQKSRMEVSIVWGIGDNDVGGGGGGDDDVNDDDAFEGW